MKQDERDVAVLRSLVIDEINAANSGHPGMALDVAPALYVLYHDFLKADPKDPAWQNRDRFVLSSGHNSALLYALLHLAGYGITVDDLKSFRQLGSKTPGHPECDLTPGVDATSGPLGLGLAQAVGMALAEEKIRASYPEGEKLCSHRTYCLLGDGCLEEGISQEAISFAGLQRLSKLTFIYDENQSTLDEPTSVSMRDDTRKRFESAHWDVFEVYDPNDLDEIRSAYSKALESTLPSLVILHSQIGYGTPLAGSHKCHGSPLGAEMGEKAKAFYGFDEGAFVIPEDVYESFRGSFAKRGRKAHEDDEISASSYEKEHPSEYAVYRASLKRDLSSFAMSDPDLSPKPESTRNASGRFLASLSKAVPFLFGGSADVAGSVKTALPGERNFLPESRDGRNLAYGIREFLMSGVLSGMALHKGLIPYGGAFLVFADYMRYGFRMASLEKAPAIFLLSHDSIAVGEDGPTHEPIETLSSLRLIPGLRVLRPADAKETFAAWRMALESQNEPFALILSRQDLPNLERSSLKGVKEGAYAVYGGDRPTKAILASGSEVSLAIEAAKILEKQGTERVRVISVPEFAGLSRLSKESLKSLLGVEREKTYALEMGSPDLWYRYTDKVYGIDRFGASGKADEVLAAYGFTAEKVAEWISEN